MSGFAYSAKTPTIINYTLINANTWYAINSEVKGVRKWFLKARESTDNSFDYDFTSGHLTYLTNGGQGVSFDGCDLPVIYTKSATAGTIMELIYWG